MEKKLDRTNWYPNTEKAVIAMRKTMKVMIALLAALLFLGVSTRALAQDQAEVTGPVPWVSKVSGSDKSLMIKQLDTDWFEATENTPIGEGDMVWQDKGGQSEIYLDKGTYLRLGPESGVQFTKLADDEVRVTLTKGEVVASDSSGTPMLLDIPGQTVVLNQGSRAKVKVADNGASQVTSKKGRVEVNGPRGQFRLDPGQSLNSDSTGNDVRLTRTNGGDSFENWSDQRDRQLVIVNSPAPAVTYLPEPAVVEMADNGVWVDDAEYGWVWRPRVVVGWAPYREGRWTWRPAWGWTWVSYEPWGWYPYHYGRWIMVSGGWAWSPVYVVHTHWSPALVFWVEGPDYIAWQPIPYSVVSVGVFLNFGPTYMNRYIDHRCITTVPYRDFNRGHYNNYVRPWPGDCRGSCQVVRTPFHSGDRHGVVTRDARTPRPNGYVPGNRAPTDRAVYAHGQANPNQRNGAVARVDYGSRAMPNRANPRDMNTTTRPGVNNGRPTNNPVNLTNPGGREATNNMHPTVPTNRSYGYRTGENNRQVPNRGTVAPGVNNGNVRTPERPAAAPNRSYQPRNQATQPGNDANNAPPRLNYGRDERGNLVQTPERSYGYTAPNNGSRTTVPNGGAAPNNARTGGQVPQAQPNRGYSYGSGNQNANTSRGNNTSRPSVNTARPNSSSGASQPAARPQYSAPQTNRATQGSTNSYRAPTSSAPSSSAPRNENRGSVSRPAPSYSAPSHNSAPSHSGNSAPARSSNRSSGGGSNHRPR